MKLAILFLGIFSYYEEGLAVTDLPVMSRIPDILQEFCPGANVCGGNQTFPAPDLTFRPGYESCCTDCSCRADCEERGDCCFPQTPPNNNSDEVRFMHTRSTCLFSVTIQPNGTEEISGQSYYMISNVPENDNLFSPNTSCGDVNVAPWGSLYPVYSAKKKLIYKNILCATADEVTDGQPWDAVLVCSKSQGFVVLEDSNSLSENCKVHFTYPGNIDDIHPLKCFSDLINTCPVTGFEKLDDIDLSKEDVIELCLSGLVSPFRGRYNMYTNVFCYICNGEYFYKKKTCQKLNDTPRTSRASFVGLIDGAFMIRAHTGSIGGKQDLPVACDVAKNAKCREILCPSGQIRTQAGECKYLTNIWYDQEFTIFIKLKSDVDININDINDQVFSGKLPPFKSPWPNNWFIDYIFYETVNGERSSKSFLVIIKSRLKQVQPLYFVRNVKMAITKDWLLESNNKSIVLQSSFMPFTTEKFIYDLETHDFPRYEIIYRSRSFPGNVLLVTKLYLCDQVELTQSEFTLTHNNDTLFNNITKRYLLNGEFAPTLSSDGIRMRLCIEDSGLYETKPNVKSDANSVLGLFVGSYFAVILLNLVNQNCYNNIPSR